MNKFLSDSESVQKEIQQLQNKHVIGFIGNGVAGFESPEQAQRKLEQLLIRSIEENGSPLTIVAHHRMDSDIIDAAIEAVKIKHPLLSLNIDRLSFPDALSNNDDVFLSLLKAGKTQNIAAYCAPNMQHNDFKTLGLQNNGFKTFQRALDENITGFYDPNLPEIEPIQKHFVQKFWELHPPLPNHHNQKPTMTLSQSLHTQHQASNLLNTSVRYSDVIPNARCQPGMYIKGKHAAEHICPTGNPSVQNLEAISAFLAQEAIKNIKPAPKKEETSSFSF